MGEPLPEAGSPRDLWGQAQGSLEESEQFKGEAGGSPRQNKEETSGGGGRGAGEEKKGCLGVLLARSEGLPCSSASVRVHHTRRLAGSGGRGAQCPKRRP